MPLSTIGFINGRIKEFIPKTLRANRCDDNLFEKFTKSVETMHEHQNFARQYSEEHGRTYFDPLKDLEEEECEKELEYATQKVAARRQKLQKILGKKAIPELAMDDDIVQKVASTVPLLGLCTWFEHHQSLPML